LVDGGFVGTNRVVALGNRKRSLKYRVHRVGVIAIRGGFIRFELRLEIGRIELSEQLAGVDPIALADVYRVGRFCKRALDRNVLIRRDDPGETPAGLNLAERRGRRLNVRRRRRGGAGVPAAAPSG
jgi:hypothetical protein